MIVVLETSGKKDAVENVRVKLFDNRADADEYCLEQTDNPKEERWWRHAEIIEEGREYAVFKYSNEKS
jgi:hypothetical protein